MIYMTSKEHGATHVLTDIEATALEARGWTRAKEPTAREIRASKGIKVKPVADEAEPEVDDSAKKQPRYSKDN